MTRPIRKVTSNSPSMVKASEASSRPPLNRVEREESQALLPPEMEPVRLIGIRLLRHGPIVDRRTGAAGHQALAALAERGLLDLLEQIGRASCRERECQDVSISVAAVSYNKKNTNKKHE